MTGISCFPPGNKRPRLLSRQCSTCIGRPGNLMYVSPGRLTGLVAAALEEGSQGIICHQTLPYGEHTEFGAALCRWFYDRYGAKNNFIRVMERIGGFEEIEPPQEGDE